MDKIYDSKSTEAKWRPHWEKLSKFSLDEDKQTYSICLPPPNVTGSLHMGHAFQQSLMDLLIRYHKMNGKNVLWQVGVDHAGIATQLLVQNKLKNIYPDKSFTREELIEEIWKWKEESGLAIVEQMKYLGSFVDWSRSRFTMDEGFSQKVKEIFIELYEEGLIYQGEKLVNWDTTLRTAVSDLEVVAEERNGLLYSISYEIDGGGELVVATTRPETMFGDVAVAVNPTGKHSHLVGKYAVTPIINRKIPIIADEMVDEEFGTGFVKITPAHDFNDYEVAQRHSLPMINILHLDGTLNDVAVGYAGLDRFVARKRLVADLEASGKLVEKKQHRLVLPISERTGVVVEPMLTKQWFMKMSELAVDAVELVEQGKIAFYPDSWKNTYFSWLKDIKDWCISRQLVWGHRIPIYYDDEGVKYAGMSEDDVRAKYSLAEDKSLHQDTDVLDTWFSSAFWTFITLGWQSDEELFKNAHPSSVLITGFDIIFFWVARMVMMTRKITKDIPFKEVYFTGLVRDFQGQKMSKSKGNVIDPVDIIDGIGLEELLVKRTGSLIIDDKKEGIIKATKRDYPNGIDSYGIDSLRATFCALSSGGRDLKFDFLRLKGYRNFTNKIWNVARFVFGNCEDFRYDGVPDFSPEDEWIFAKLKQTTDSYHKNISVYRFDYVINNSYDFFWHDYCDWYVEIAKIILREANSDTRYQKQYVLLKVLEQSLRLLHPIMPFITEETWQMLKSYLPLAEDSIVLTRFSDGLIKEQNPEIEAMIDVIKAIRSVKSFHKILKNHTIKIHISKDLIYNRLVEEMSGVELVATSDKYVGIDIVGDYSIGFVDVLDRDREVERMKMVLANVDASIEKLDEGYSRELIKGLKEKREMLTKEILL